MKRVLALDPGDRVGWARVAIDDNGLWHNLDHGITDLKECALKVAEVLDVAAGYNGYDDGCGPHTEYDLVIIERWSLFARFAKKLVGSEMPSSQFVGMVKLACWLSGTPFVMQAPSKVNSNQPGVLSPAEKSMSRLRPELFELVMQPGAHDDLHDMVAIKHLWAYTFDNYPVR